MTTVLIVGPLSFFIGFSFAVALLLIFIKGKTSIDKEEFLNSDMMKRYREDNSPGMKTRVVGVDINFIKRLYKVYALKEVRK